MIAGTELLAAVRKIARDAACEILDVYAAGAPAVTRKADDTPVTEADMRAHVRISAALAALTPHMPVLSEESADVPLAERTAWRRYWLVDPLDGTREFLKRNGEFTVNIALIEDHAPVLGVVHLPVSGVAYGGVSGVGAFRFEADGASWRIEVARRAAMPPRVAVSSSHRGSSLDRFLAGLGPYELVSVGSSIKFGLLAEGLADVYPRLGPTGEWDTAAGHAVLAAAGGRVVDLDGRPLEYNRRESLINPDFVAFGPAERDWVSLLRRSA
jgi:3'(2'), 5'-bisphosphate nucleotidase